MPAPPLDPWTISSVAVREAYEYREEIQGIWGRLATLLLGNRSRIAVTGAEGAGKTVLADHLTGIAYGPDYELPAQSMDLEKRKLRAKGQRMGLAVVPGQEMPVRRETLADLFDGRKPLDGVVHVVANGFARPREFLAEQALDEAGTTLQELREAVWDREATVLAEICQEVRRMMGRHRSTRLWLILVVNKMDLFSEPDDLRNARERYLTGRFRDPLDNLQRDVGGDRLQIEARPASGWLEDFRWGQDVVPSSFSLGQRDLSIRGLSKLIEALVGARG